MMYIISKISIENLWIISLPLNRQKQQTKKPHTAEVCGFQCALPLGLEPRTP